MRVLSLAVTLTVLGCASIDRSPCFTPESKARGWQAVRAHLGIPPGEPIGAEQGADVILHCDAQPNSRLSCAPLDPQHDAYDEVALVFARELELCPGSPARVGFALRVPRF